jgi:hypothetical protein
MPRARLCDNIASTKVHNTRVLQHAPGACTVRADGVPPLNSGMFLLLQQRRVQLKRHEALQRARNRERLDKMKEDRKIRTEIVRIGRGEVPLPLGTLRSSGSSKGRLESPSTGE